jgi:hypothetical protein
MELQNMFLPQAPCHAIQSERRAGIPRPSANSTSKNTGGGYGTVWFGAQALSSRMPS